MCGMPERDIALHIAFGKQVANARKYKGLSQREVAQIVGTSERAVWQWEAGENGPRFEKLMRLARLLNLDLNIHKRG